MNGRRQTLRYALGASLGAGLGLAAPWVRANAPWPSKPLTVVTPYPPNQGADLLVQLLAAQLQQQLGQSVVVDRRGAVGGSMAAWIAAQGNADGHTWFFGTTYELIASASYRRLGFNISADLIPLCTVARVPLMLLVQPSGLNAVHHMDFIKRLRARPNQYTFGSPGRGTLQHDAIEQLMQQARSSVAHVAYRTAALALDDLLGGTVDLALDTPGVVAPHLQAGKLRALVVAHSERLHAFSQVPTGTEMGLRDWYATLNYGLWAVRGTPAPVMERMAQEVERALRRPDLGLVWAHFGAVSMYAPTLEYSRQVRGEIDRWQRAQKTSAAVSGKK